MKQPSHETTIHTYDTSAEQLAEFFAGIGPRTEDISKAIELTGRTDDLMTVEIGCGDGRDAAEIIPRVTWYEGVDPSEGMLALARQRARGGHFTQADALSYKYPDDVDIIFAFASLLHVSREDMNPVMRRFHAALKPEGIAYLSLKHRAEYAAEMQTDAYGSRMFYYYSQDEMLNMAGNGFKPVLHERQVIGSTEWMTLALRKTED